MAYLTKYYLLLLLCFGWKSLFWIFYYKNYFLCVYLKLLIETIFNSFFFLHRKFLCLCLKRSALKNCTNQNGRKRWRNCCEAVSDSWKDLGIPKYCRYVNFILLVIMYEIGASLISEELVMHSGKQHSSFKFRRVYLIIFFKRNFGPFHSWMKQVQPREGGRRSNAEGVNAI